MANRVIVGFRDEELNTSKSTISKCNLFSLKFCLAKIFILQEILQMKTAIISGAGGALGSGIKNKFLSKGYFVNGLYHHSPDRTKEPLKENEKDFEVDLLDENAVESLVKEIAAEQKEIDVLVCTAGGFAMNTIEKATAGDLQKQIDLNFKTAYHLVRPVYLQMKKQGRGRIFLTGSRQGLVPSRGTHALAYTISKSMLFTLSEVLNADAKDDVVISMVVPSMIDTPANRRDMPDADFNKWASPDRIAEVIAFYSSDEAKIIREPVIKVYNQS